MNARSLMIAALFACGSYSVGAQDWAMEVYAQIGSQNCSGNITGENVSISIQGKTPPQPSTNGFLRHKITFGDASLASYSGAISTTGTLKCACGTPQNPIPGCTPSTSSVTVTVNVVFHPGLGPQCTIVTGTGSNANFGMSISVRYFQLLQAPTVPNALNCDNSATIVSGTTVPGNTYIWQVSDNQTNKWQNLTTKTTKTITVNRSEVNLPMFNGNYRYFRVNDASCTQRMSAASQSMRVYLDPPSAATVSWTEPTCNGRMNGAVTITNVIAASDFSDFPKYLYELYYTDGGGNEAMVYQRERNNTEWPIRIDSVDITAWLRKDGGTATDGIRKGSWKLIIRNNTNVSEYGTCGKEFSTGIAEPSPVIATASRTSNHNGFGISCIGAVDGSATVTANGGNLGGYTYRWPNGSTGTSISGLGAGTYTVKVKDSKNCPASANVILEAPTPMTVTIATDKVPTCAESSDGRLIVSVTHGAGLNANSYRWSNNQTTALASNLKENTYSVTITDINGCIGSASQFLDAPPAMSTETEITSHYIFNGTDYAVQCNQGNGRARVKNITNGTGSFTYQWSNGEISIEAEALSATTHTVVTTDSKGCKHTATTPPLTSSPSVDASIRVNVFHNGKAITCHGESDGSLAVDLSNAVGPIVYAWSSGHATPIATGLAAGNYTLLVTDARSCKATASFPLGEPAPVQPKIDPLLLHHGQAISCPGENDGTLRASATGGTGDYISYKWDNGPSTADFPGLSAGTYTVRITDSNDCSGTISGTLSDPLPVNPSITVATAYNGFAIKCHNGSDGELHASATGGAQGYTFEWSTGSTNPVLTAIPAGTYSLVAHDANGCTGNTSLTIANPPLVTTSIAITSDYNGKHIRCHNESNGTLIATASGGTNSFTFKWNTNATGSSLSGLSAGTYTVTAKDMNGCEANDSETLINPAPVIVSITETSNYNNYGVRCHTFSDGYLQATAAGGTESFTYLWNNAETTPRTSDLSAGIYSITITDSNGCFDTETAEITSPPVLNLGLDSKTDILCFDAPTGELAVTTAGGAGTYEYSINGIDWQPSPAFNSLKAAGYMVHVRDDNGCIDVLSEILTQPTKITIDFASTPAFCADPRGEATATVTGGVGSYAYTWTDDESTVLSTTTAITNRKAGIYTLKVVDDNDCPMVKPVGIISSDGPQAVVKEVIDAKCSYSSDGSGILEITDGDAPFTYRWPDGQTTIQGVNLAKGIYHVLVTDVNDCESVFPVEIGAPDELDISAAETINPSCFGFCDGSIIVATAGGTEPYTYTWNGQSGAQAIALCVGGHSVAVKDSNGCEHEEGFVLEQPDPLQIQLTTRALPLCFQACNGTLAVTVTGGNGGNSYRWSSGAQTAEAPNICAGDHTIKVTDSKNCQIEKTYVLGQPEKLQVVLSGKQIPVCNNGCDGKLEVTAFGGTGAYHYAWSTGVNTSSLKDICSSDYTVSVEDDHACSVKGTYTIENPPALSIDLGGSVTLCEGQTHDLEAYGNWVVYKWNSNVGFSASESRVTINAPGLYWLDVHNSDGCIAQDTFLLETSIDLLEASFLMPKEAFVNDTIAMIDISWPLPETSTWTFPSDMHKILDMGDVVYGKFLASGIYEISLESQLGKCLDQVGKTIAILNSQTEETEDGRLGYKEEYVKEFSLYPNPTDGKFEIAVELREEGNTSVSVWHTPTGYLLKQVQGTGKKDYKWNIDLRPATSGTYVIRLDHAKGKNYIRFVVK